MQKVAISMEQVHQDTKTGSVHKLTHHQSRGGFRGTFRGRGRGQQSWRSQRDQTSDGECERCLGEHSSDECPYRKATCHNCRRKGHIKPACRNGRRPQSKQSKASRQSAPGNTKKTGKVRQINEEEQDEESEEYNLYSIEKVNAVNSTKKACFEVELKVEGKPITFAVDTQAAVSVLPYNIYLKELAHCALEPPSGILKSYTDHEIPVKGEIQVMVEHEGQKVQLPLMVVNENKEALLGRTWLRRIRLNWDRLFRTFSVSSIPSPVMTVVEKFGDVFKRGKEHNEVKHFKAELKLKENAKPIFAKARPVPYALKEAVEENLEASVKSGILVPVKTSRWASPVVVAPKADKSIRLCGDYKS